MMTFYIFSIGEHCSDYLVTQQNKLIEALYPYSLLKERSPTSA